MSNNKNITFDQLKTSMTKVKAEIDKKANTNHGTHVPTTGTANNATYLRNDNQWHKIVPSDIGAAPTSHGDHVTYSSTSPSAPGTASAGSAANVSRGDHVHPLQTSVSGSSGSCTGNAATATKLKTARNIALTGTITGNANFDGSGNISIATSVDSTPTTGSYFKGVPVVTSAGVMKVGKYIDFHNAADSNADYDVRLQCNGTSANTVNMPTSSGTLALLGDNVASATKLRTARKIGKASFNGTANIALFDIMGRATTSTSGSNNKNKYTKFARIDISSGTYTNCCGKLSIMSSESNQLQGILDYYFRTNDTISSVTINLYWTSLSASDYNNTVYAVKVSDGVYDLYYKPLADWETIKITNIDCTGSDKITFYSSQSFVSSITAVATSSLYSCSSACLGNANTATTLKTARTINGTSFNGSANITTANWGTARTLTIGNSGKSVNGSGNVSWTLDEIGAAAKSHGNHVPATQTADNKKFLRNDNTWQTVTPANIGAVPTGATGNITIHADNNANSTSDYVLIKAGHNGLKVTSSAGGETVTKEQDKLTFNGNIVYHAGRKPTLSELGAAAASHTHNYAGSSSAGGNANAAVKLATARSINGTSFNGTADITTANWGTARNIKIGNTSKSVNGSEDVTWTLSDIGALPAAGGTLKGTLNITKSGDKAKLLTFNTERPWSFQQGGTGSTATLDLVSSADSKTFRVVNASESKSLRITTSSSSVNLATDGSITSTGYCVKKGDKELWIDMDDTSMYLYNSASNCSFKMNNDGTLAYGDNKIYHAGNHNMQDHAGQGNNFSTAVGSIYFKNSSNTYAARISSYHNTNLDQDYAHMGIRDANDNMPNYINLYPDTVRIKSNNVELGGKRLTIATSAPSNPASGDVWINIG